MIERIIKKRVVAFILVISIITPSLYAPIFAARAHAFLGFGDLVIDIKALAERIVDNIAMVLAQKMIDKITKSTIEWAQSGFDGNPAYTVNPAQYFLDIADGVAGDFIAGSDLNFLCSPFQAQVRLALRTAYLGPDNKFQCTISDIAGNIEGFYDNFNQGGWETWFEMTQNNANNPYGAYLEARVELDNRLAKFLDIENKKIGWSNGFLSFPDKSGPCAVWKDTVTIDTPADDSVEAATESVRIERGECLVYAKTSTPGSVIAEQLNKVLPTGLEKLQVAQHVDQLISAFATGLLQRYVFGPQGLFNKQPNTSSDTQKPPEFQNIREPSICDTALTLNLSEGETLDENCNVVPVSVAPRPPAPSPVVPVTPNLPPAGQVSVTASANSGTAPLNNVVLTAANGEPGQYFYYFYCSRPESDTPPPVPSGFNNTPALITDNVYTNPAACSYPSAGTYRAKVISFKLIDESGATVSPLVYREAWTTVTVTP